eukprot:TRINITY_DN57390_c0_g1_i1.p1 TRINITY_DN57390_c0_g1~~TRINITY_DN57390_c0_g1_i1.p1  ORF type:complete len:118 (-),score=10.04 TRINITY_DN57390_c0_g1_i1:77-430(-)
MKRITKAARPARWLLSESLSYNAIGSPERAATDVTRRFLSNDRIPEAKLAGGRPEIPQIALEPVQESRGEGIESADIGFDLREQEFKLPGSIAESIGDTVGEQLADMVCSLTHSRVL